MVLPAVPMVNLYSPGWMAPGSKLNSLEPTCAPSALAVPMAAAAVTAVRCWRCSPGLSRRALTL